MPPNPKGLVRLDDLADEPERRYRERAQLFLRSNRPAGLATMLRKKTFRPARATPARLPRHETLLLKLEARHLQREFGALHVLLGQLGNRRLLFGDRCAQLLDRALQVLRAQAFRLGAVRLDQTLRVSRDFHDIPFPQIGGPGCTFAKTSHASALHTAPPDWLTR